MGRTSLTKQAGINMASVRTPHYPIISTPPGGAADKTKVLKVGDEIISVNNTDCTRMSRIEAWNFMKKLGDGTANLVVRQKIDDKSKESAGNGSAAASSAPVAAESAQVQRDGDKAAEVKGEAQAEDTATEA